MSKRSRSTNYNRGPNYAADMDVQPPPDPTPQVAPFTHPTIAPEVPQVPPMQQMQNTPLPQMKGW